ncbi:protein-tyrosine phosphatase family protein [Morganella morganii]|uniref:protein-tyrosine phosphatase family protein n=1 Tax=Morganella morganii TaxID=582 RepID=UPI003EB69EE7
MNVVPYVMIHDNQNNNASPPPVPPRSVQHQGRTMALQEPSGRPPAVPPRPEHTGDVQLRQKNTNPGSGFRHAMYDAPASSAKSLPSPAGSQERGRMPLPGEGIHPSLAQRRAAPQLAPFTPDTKTEMSFSLLQAKSEQQFVRSNYIDKGNPQYFGDFNDNKVEHQRFGDINTCKVTQLFTAKGIGLPANQMKVDGENLAMRSQYPAAEKLGSHLSMLAEQKPAVLVILSSDADLKARNLPAYFRETEGKHYNDAKYDKDPHSASKYDDVFVQCKKNTLLPVKMAGNLSVRNYRIEITVNGKTTPISVMHVNNWEDRTTVDTKTLKTLVADINAKIDQKTRADSSYSPQPFIHCSAGIGRTGVVAAAMELLKPGNNKTPLDIALQLRKTGCSKMVQTEAQFDTLVHLYDNIKSGH